MDYSLLVGLHFRETSSRECLTPRSRTSGTHSLTGYLPFGISLWLHHFNMNSYRMDELIFQETETLTMKERLNFLE